MATYVPINKHQVKQCNRCAGTITFVKNRDGKWFPVDAFTLPSREWVYRAGVGACGNLTPWHRCSRNETAQSVPAADPQADRKKALVDRNLELLDAGMEPKQIMETLTAEFADLV